ncbi:MAG: exodeoxyribonuclease VII large subunit, partial [Pseudomonadota bacterium]
KYLNRMSEMSDLFQTRPAPSKKPDDSFLESTSAASNIIEYSVSELSQKLRQLIEGQFDHIRIRGEISGLKKAASGHFYFTLKDENAVLNAVCWRGKAAYLKTQPEEGFEVIITGKLTTYQNRSYYQLIVEQIEHAGQGALLQMLEQRKQKLAQEGLFDPQKKRKIPTLPQRIAVITSPTGAVIRDLIHRLNERMPVHLQIMPVPVQGAEAEKKIVEAILSFDRLADKKNIPDLIIIARGGGSLEDLWVFNSESIVRAVSRCQIPIISAIGHETDTTLIDLVADLRAPTPTAAGEIAVPVLSELKAGLLNLKARKQSTIQRLFIQQAKYIKTLTRPLAHPKITIERKWQSYDELIERLILAKDNRFKFTETRLNTLKTRLIEPKALFALRHTQLANTSKQMKQMLQNLYLVKQHQWQKNILPLHHLQKLLRINVETLNRLKQHTSQSWVNYDRRLSEQLQNKKDILKSLSYQNILKRGFVLLRDEKSQIIRTKNNLTQAKRIQAQFDWGRAWLEQENRPHNIKDTIKHPSPKKNEQKHITQNVSDDLFDD